MMENLVFSLEGKKYMAVIEEKKVGTLNNK